MTRKQVFVKTLSRIILQMLGHTDQVCNQAHKAIFIQCYVVKDISKASHYCSCFEVGRTEGVCVLCQLLKLVYINSIRSILLGHQ